MATFGTGFQMPAAAAPVAAPVANPAPPPAAVAPAATTTAVVPLGPPSVLTSTYEDYSTLLSLIQDGWSRSVDVDQLRRALMQYAQQMAQVQEERPSSVARASIQSKNVEMDGMKMNLSDERTVGYILDVSQLLNLNEHDALRIVYQAAQSLARSQTDFGRASGAEVQAQIKIRAIELYYKRRLNLLTAMLDLILMERDGGRVTAQTTVDEDPISRVVNESVSDLMRLGVTRNVMIAIEAMYHQSTTTTTITATAATGAVPAQPPQPTPPLLIAYRSAELNYLLRILFALFRSSQGAGIHDVAGEDLLRLVELIQTRSAAIASAAQAQADAQKAAATAKPVTGAAATLPQAPVAPTPAPTTPAQNSTELFNCYVLLCSLIAALECKYHSLAGSLSVRSDMTSDRAAQASQANADADFSQLLNLLQRKIASHDNWSHDIMRCGTLLSWSLFLRRVRNIAMTSEISEEEVQGLVLDGLGGNENSGLWIDLYEQIQTNPSFAGMRSDSFGAVAGASSSTAVTATNRIAHSISSSLLEELGEVLGEFFHHIIVFHGKEMDLLRREDRKTEQNYQRQVQRYKHQQQHQQQHLYQLQQHGGYGAMQAQANQQELPRPPKLNYSAFLSLLSLLIRSTPSLVPLLWSSPEFESFLAAELHDSKSIASSLQANQSPFDQQYNAATAAASSFHHASSSGSIFTSDSPFILLYVDLLSSLCADSLSAMTVYNFVRHCSRLNWDMVITNFLQQNLIQTYLPSQTQQAQQLDQRGARGGYAMNPRTVAAAVPPPQPLTQKQFDLLASLLNLLSSVLRPSPTLQEFFVTHADWKLLDTMFALLGLPGLGVHIKAKVVVCIASMVRLNAAQAAMAWERLERSQILPTVNYANALIGVNQATQRTSLLQGGNVNPAAPLEGLLFDLEEIENNMQTYPLTTAFLELIHTLLESTPVPRQLGVGVRNTNVSNASSSNNMIMSDQDVQQNPGVYGIAPYVSFVTSHVFLNLPHRMYLQPMEQFAIAEACFAIFTSSIQDFIVDMHAEAVGVRVEFEGSFHARHMSHQFMNPNGSAVDTSNQQRQQAQHAALRALSVHPAYTILRDLLTARELYQQVLTAMNVAHSMLESEAGVGVESTVQVTHPSVEGTLLMCMKLLWSVLEEEEHIVETLQRIDSLTSTSVGALGAIASGRYSTLSSLLLQHQPTILTLTKSVGYIQSHLQTNVQRLLTEKSARATAAKRRSKGSLFDGAQQNNTSMFQNQSMYEEVEDETMLAAAAASSTSSEEDAQSIATEVAFYASSSLLLLSVRDDSRIVHIVEANQATLEVIAAFQRQIKNIQLPSEIAGEIIDPDLQGNKARLVILDLLLSSLLSPSPATPHISLAFVLLGFDIATPAAVQQTDLLRSTRRSLFDTLFFDLNIKPGFAQHFPTLSQSVFQLMYKLVSHPLTSTSTIRCLKSHPHGDGSVAIYLTRLLQSLPIVSDIQFLTRLIRSDPASGNIVPAVITIPGASNQVYQSLFQLSWILKSVNLHYFLSVGFAARSRNNQTMGLTEEWMVDEELDRYLSDLGFLEQDLDAFENGAADGMNDRGESNWLAEGNNSSFLHTQQNSANGTPIRSGIKLLDILSNIHTYLRTILPSTFEFDAPPTIVGASSGSSGFDLSTLKYHDTQYNSVQYALNDVYSSCLLHGLTPKDAYTETRKCLEWNIVTSVLGCARSAFEAWKQCVEVIVLNSSEVLIRKNIQRYENILIQILQKLLQKLLPSEDDGASAGFNMSRGSANGAAGSLSIWLALSEELSSLSLTVISKLREVLHFTTSSPHLDSLGSSNSLRSTQFQSILPLLISSILSTRHSATRINLYAIFLNYILYNKERNVYIEKQMNIMTESTNDNGERQQQASRWLAIQQEQLQFDSQNLSLLSSHNLSLLTLVVNDALDGSSKLRSVSYRFLNMMLLGSSSHTSFQIASRTVKDTKRMNGPSRFFGGAQQQQQQDESVLPSNFTASCLSIFQKNNLLLLFLNQIKANDEAIQSAIYADGSRALHHYDLLLNLECCLSFFLQLSMLPEGAKMMVEYQLVRVFTSLNFLTSRPAPSGHAVGEYENSASMNGIPTPFEKYQSIYLLVLQILVQLLSSLPNHTMLISQVQRFIESSHHDLLASIIKDSLAQVSALSLELLSTTLSLVYQMLRAGAASSGILDGTHREEQRKVAKIGPGTRGTVRQTGATTYEMSNGASDDATTSNAFTSFAQKYEPFLLLLLARYAQPHLSARLRTYLTAHLRSATSQSDRIDPAFDSILQRGDESMQVIFRKIMGLLVLQVQPDADGDSTSKVVLFGPHIGDGTDSGMIYEDSVDAHNPAKPNLDLLLAILNENHSRLQQSHRQLFTLRKNLEQLTLASNSGVQAASSPTDRLYPDISNGASSVSSSIAALELEYFPPSAASAFFYQELDSTQRVKLLHQRIQDHVHTQQSQINQYCWNIEHALMLLYHHVRVYLPSSATHRHTLSGAGHPGQVSPADFRAHAESVLLPMLSQIQQTLQSTSPNHKAIGNGANTSTQLEQYRPELNIHTFQARLAANTGATSFTSAIIMRISKLVLG